LFAGGKLYMQNPQNAYLRFVGLKFRDYKVFRGLNEFRFNRRRTLIVGKEGTGKTIIAKALEFLGAPKINRENFTIKDRRISSVAVITEGNSSLISKYRSLIFLNCEVARDWALHNREFKMAAKIPNDKWEVVKIKAQTIFRDILFSKPWKIDLHRDFNTDAMAAGERICFGYSFVFALRRTFNLNIPIVLDSPYGMLDMELRKGLSDFLKAQPCQQILLGFECAFSEEESPKYILVHVENYSQVMEF